MKYYEKKEVKQMEEQGNIDYALFLKGLRTTDSDCIELWAIEHEKCLIKDHYLPNADEVGYVLWVEMGSVGQFVNCETKDLFVACQKFNTILATIKA